MTGPCLFRPAIQRRFSIIRVNRNQGFDKDKSLWGGGMGVWGKGGGPFFRKGLLPSPTFRTSYNKKAVANPKKIKKPALSVMAVRKMLEACAGSRPTARKIKGMLPPASAPSSMSPMSAAPMTMPSSGDEEVNQTPHAGQHRHDRPGSNADLAFAQHGNPCAPAVKFFRGKLADHHGKGLLPGVPGLIRHHRHEHRQQRHASNGTLKHINHKGRHHGGQHIHDEPRQTYLYRFQPRRIHSLILTGAPQP